MHLYHMIFFLLKIGLNYSGPWRPYCCIISRATLWSQAIHQGYKNRPKLFLHNSMEIDGPFEHEQYIESFKVVLVAIEITLPIKETL